MSVSYTHLDVYKRQEEDRRENEAEAVMDSEMKQQAGEHEGAR